MNVIQHNLMAMNANRQLGISTEQKSKASEKLSSGYKINRASDDTAGLSISEKMRWQIRGLNRGSYNISDGISLINTADGAMAEISSMLDRMKELSVQAANDTNTESDRAAIQLEVDELVREVDRISSTTEFNGMSILDNSFGQKVDETTGTVLYGLAYILGGDQITTTGMLDQTYPVSTLGINAWGDPTGRDYLYTKNIEIKYPDGSVINMSNEIYQKIDNELAQYPADGTTIAINNADGTVDNISRSGKKITINTVDASGMLVSEQTIHYQPKLGTICGAKINFSGLGKTYQLSDLYNMGFNSKCATCGAHYSIKFIEGTTNNYSGGDGNPVVEIGIDGATNGTDLVRKIMDALKDPNGQYFINHFTQYAQDDATLYVCDYRKSITSGAYTNSVFEPIVYGSGDETPPRQPFHIQYSSNQNDYIEMYLPNVTPSRMGILGLNVMTYKDASLANEAIEKAIAYLSEERSALGAYSNRLEHGKLVVDNTAENTQAAESKLRDTEMATMMVAFSKYNILSQAGQSMLAQANQSQQDVMKLFE